MDYFPFEILKLIPSSNLPESWTGNYPRRDGVDPGLSGICRNYHHRACLFVAACLKRFGDFVVFGGIERN